MHGVEFDRSVRVPDRDTPRARVLDRQRLGGNPQKGPDTLLVGDTGVGGKAASATTTMPSDERVELGRET